MKSPSELLENWQFVWLFQWYELTDGIEDDPINPVVWEGVENGLIRESRRWGTLFFTPKPLSNESLQG